MSEFMPDSGPGDRAKGALRAVVPVVALVIVAALALSYFGDYRRATQPDAGDGSVESTGSVEATQATEAAEGSAVESGSEDGESTGSESDEDVQYVVVRIAGLNYRAEPKADAEVMRTLPEGTRLALLGQQNGWYQVRDEDGVTGWVSSSSQYVELVDE